MLLPPAVDVVAQKYPRQNQRPYKCVLRIKPKPLSLQVLSYVHGSAQSRECKNRANVTETLDEAEQSRTKDRDRTSSPESKGNPKLSFVLLDVNTLTLRFAGRPVRQIELYDRHAEIVIARERTRGFEIFDRRDWR